MASDPPPAYSTLDAPTTNLAAAEDRATNCNDGTIQQSTIQFNFLINNSFEDKTTRIGFIQKVLATKLLQLLSVAVFFIIFKALMPGFKWSLDRGSHYDYLILLSILAFIVTLWLLVRVCKDQNRQQNAIRYVFLVVYPLSFAFMVTFLTIFWDLAPVLVAWITYCWAVFALMMYSIFALGTNLEFTVKYGAIVCVCTQIAFYTMIVPFTDVHAGYTLFVTIALGVDTVYVVWELEIMTSKSYWTHITPSNYLDGVLNLHIDYYYITSKFLYPKILESVKTGGSS